MMQSKSFAKIPGATYAISNTGPLISAFQSDSFELITKIFPTVFISTVCMAELEDHGWKDEIQAASPQLVVMKLTVKEKKRALIFARQISQHPDTNDPVIENHLGESQAIVLALRSEHKNDLLLLDELAARSIAGFSRHTIVSNASKTHFSGRYEKTVRTLQGKGHSLWSEIH